MEMDCSLKKLAKFFKFFLDLSEKSLKTDYSLFFLGQITKIFFSRCSKSNFLLEKASLSNTGVVFTKIQYKLS